MGSNFSTHELFMERFPKLGLLCSSWESQRFAPEAMDALDPGKADALYIYGLGSGASYFLVRAWLQENGRRKLIFLEEDSAQIGSFLQDERAQLVLSDPQVHIELISDPKKEIDAIARKFPYQRIEIVPLPSRKGRKFQALRLQLLRKTTLAYALRLDRLCGYQPLQNFLRNLVELPRSFFANRLQGAFRSVPAIVCGAGPSLNQAIPLLKQLDERALIIAGGSTIAALSAKSIVPHFGLAIDPNLEEYRRFRNSFAFEMPLLYSTRVFPAVFQTCNGPFGYMRSGIGGVPELWMEEELGLLGPFIGEELSSEAISVTTIAVAWAQFLGCNPILFAGLDLAYTNNKRYADAVIQEGETPFAAIDAEKSAADRIVKRKNRHGKPVHTAIRWVMESASLAHFAKKHPTTQFFNTTEGGIDIRGVPFLSLEQAVEQHFAQSYDLRARVQQSVAAAPMPQNSEKIIAEKVKELTESLARVVHRLEILAGKTADSKALAEVELEEESAMNSLFYDIHDLIGNEQDKWDRFLDLAKQYQEVIHRSQ